VNSQNRGRGRPSPEFLNRCPKLGAVIAGHNTVKILVARGCCEGQLSRSVAVYLDAGDTPPMCLGRAKRAYSAGMRCPFVRFIIILAIAYSLTWQPNTRAQVDVPRSEAGTNGACSSPPLPVHKQSSTVQVTIAELTFNGDMQMQIEDRDKLSTSLQQQTFSGDVDRVKDQILERVRVAWQNHGYFNVHVQGDAKVLTSSPFSHAIAVTVLVDEGVQYRLKKITFNGNKEITDLRALRRQFPLQDGDIFTRTQSARASTTCASPISNSVILTLRPSPTQSSTRSRRRFLSPSTSMKARSFS
jgi:hypothetical protein